MTVSVVVCAYTIARWDQLVLAVESLDGQQPPCEPILVIDHNPQLYARARERWPHHTVIENAGAQGLSSSRNTALELVRTPIVAFLDDDAYADPQWLTRLYAPFDDADVVAVGGAAVPIWPDAAPAVLPDELLWIVGCSYRGLPTELAPVRNVMGCSMAFRTEPLREIGGFNPTTGRVGSLPIGCEETEACIELTAASPHRRVMYEPRALVHHHVSPDRTGLRYVVRRSWCEGLSKAAISRTIGMRSALSSESSYVTGVLLPGLARHLRAGRRGAAAAFAVVLSVALAGAGYLAGSVLRVSGRPSAHRPPLHGPDAGAPLRPSVRAAASTTVVPT